MRGLLLSLCLPFALLLTSAPFASAAPATRGNDTPLLLISIDGFRADYFTRGKSPTLARIAKHGVHAAWMQPSFPALTFPNHYTLVTGLYPDHHGIVNNQMSDPTLGTFSPRMRKAVTDGRWWSEGEPIWVSADKAGLKTATMFWPGAGARIRGHRPDHWRPFDANLPASERVDQVLQWLDLPAPQRPDFITLYFNAVDRAGHRHGPDSVEVDAAIAHVDKALTRLVEGLKVRHLFHHINILVVSDHGMASSPKGQYILVDKLIDLRHVTVVPNAELAGFTPKPGYEKAIAARLLKPHAHMTCWRKQDIPARFHYGTNARIPPLDCLADVGWQMTTSRYRAQAKYPMPVGSHGYDNTDPRMRALFIAHGPAFRSGLMVPAFPNVDVYPLMAHLLGITAQPGDGRYQAVEGMLKPAWR